MNKALIIISVLFLLPYWLYAQFSISGKAISYEDAKPLPGASVFLNNTTIGCTTDKNGNFKLAQIKPGKYDIVVSMVGFSPENIPISVVNQDVVLPVITLHPRINTLREVTVTIHADPERDKYLEIFQNIFLGTSERARQCKILNPELLDFSFDKSSQVLSASSDNFLNIENKALGYRVKYLLSNFRFDQKANQFSYGGSVLFEKLQGTDAQFVAWQKQRNELYNNSVTHFLKAAVENRLQENGFSVFRLIMNPARAPDSVINLKIKQFSLFQKDRNYRDSLIYWEKQQKLPQLSPKQIPVAITASDLITKTQRRGIYSFSCDNDALLIIYNRKGHYKLPTSVKVTPNNESPNTLIVFYKPVIYFSVENGILNPEGLSYFGAWANERVADLFPLDFRPVNLTPSDSSFYRKIDTGLSHLLNEKAYLQLDKPCYAAGDTIYFKAYLLANRLRPKDIETSLNINLLRADGHRMDQLRLKVEAGVAAGDFALPDTLSSGNYRIAAYENSNVDCSIAPIFEERIPIINNEYEIKKQAKAKKGRSQQPQLLSVDIAKVPIDVHFFPEGGNMVDGVVCKVAFKAIDHSGTGVNVSGFVTDQAGRQICSIRSNHLGMGYIELTPESGKTYKAVISWGGQHREVFSLPKVNDSGYHFSIDNSKPKELEFHITAARLRQQEKITVVGESNGHICYYINPQIHNGKFDGRVLSTVLPAGIVRFTLFSGTGEPMNERIVFIRKTGQVNLSLTPLQQKYTTRGKTAFRLKCNDADGRPANGNFSISVINETMVPAGNESTIFTHFLLTSELSGYIEQPEYYFTDAPDVNADLDVLLLTQGYREFQWKSLFQKGSGDCEHIKGAFVSGTIRTLNGKPIAHARVSMISVSKSFFSADTVANQEGRFIFWRYPVDSMRYVIQATDQSVRKKSVIELDKMEASPGIKDTVTEWDSVLVRRLSKYGDIDHRFHSIQTQLGFGRKNIALKEVIVKGTFKKNSIHSGNLNGAGVANEVIRGDQLPLGCLTFKDCIVSHLHGVKYINGNFYYESAPTLVVLDGIEIPGNIKFAGGQIQMTNGPSQADVLDSLNPSDIASIEILTDASMAAIYGVKAAGGVIIITMKTGEDVLRTAKDAKVNYQYYTPIPYYKARVFYAPKYEYHLNDQTADLRTTVYWNPSVKIVGDSGVNLEFYNSDAKGTYRIVVEGVDEKGNPGCCVYYYSVN